MRAHPALARARELATPPTAEARTSGDVASPGGWEFLVASDATGAALLGPATAPREAEAVRRQIEALTGRAGFTHWWDPALAKAWAARAVELTSDAEQRRLEAAPYEEQVSAVREAWAALSSAYRALNIPWMIDPSARRLYTGRTNGADSRNGGALGEWRDAATRFDPGPYRGTEDASANVIIHNRITLDTESRVVDYLHASETDPERWPVWSATEAGSIREWSWHAYAWRYECARTGAGACPHWDNALFPPLFWYFLLAQDIARSLHTRGPLRVLAEATRCAFVLNVKSAHEAGVLSRVVGDAAANQLAGLSSVQLARTHIPDETADEVAEKIGAVAPLAAAIPGVGTVVAAVTGAVAAAIAAFNQLFARFRAVQRDLDPWGRDRPVFEQTYLSGGATRAQPPTHTVAEPPGWSRPLSFPTLVYIPTTEVIEAAKADEAHSHPAARPARGVPGAVLAMGLVAILGIVALVTRDRWADDVRGG